MKKWLPHLFSVLVFLGITIIYFAPVVFENKDLEQGDVKNTLAWGKDLREYHYQTGEYAFWSNNMFSGMPANYTYMPPFTNIFNFFYSVLAAVLPINLILFFLYLLGFYIFLVSLKCKPWLSIIGAIAYALTSYNIIIIGAGHINKALVMSTMAPVIGGIILCYRKKYISGTIITLIFTGLNVLWEHQQISYYLLLIIVVLALVYLIYAIKEHTLKDYFKSSLLLLVIALLAVSPALGSLISTADYAKDTMRGGSVLKSNEKEGKESSGLDIDYAYAWSYGKAETMTLLIPNFYGASSSYNIGENSEYCKVLKKAGYGTQAVQASKHAPMYWGDQPFTSGPVYMGAIICFLFVLGIMIVNGPEKWWLLIATIIAVVMSWGRHFPIINDFLFYNLPLYNKFRIPSMSLVIAEVTMVTLGILALKEVFYNKEALKTYLKPLYIATGITGGLCLLFALFGGTLMSFSAPSDSNYQNFPELLTAITADRKHMLTTDAWRSFIFIILAAAAVWLYVNEKIKTTHIVLVIGLLIFIDMWTVDKRFLNFDSFVPKKKAIEIVATSVDKQILQDKDPNYRVFNMIGNPFGESNTSYFHKSIGGYSPAKLRRYQDIIDHHFSKGINDKVLNMLNARYIIVPSDQGPQVQMNPGALGNAWFVDQLKWVGSPDDEIVALNDFNPTQTAVIDQIWKDKVPNWENLQHEKDSTATIRLTEYANPGYLIYESTSNKPHLAVFSEVFYKTWHAYIDGVEAPLIQVNYILRGLEVPAGNHKIEFKCIDEVYERGAKISWISSIIVGVVLISLFAYALWATLRKK